jgi:hypothetical protein
MRKLLLTLLLAVPAAALAQTTTDDGLSFGARAQVEADAKLAPGLHLTAHEQVRYYFDSEDILRLHTGIGLEYKMFPFLKVGAEYELINRYEFDKDLNANAWSIRHRGNFFLTGTFKTDGWQFGLKETLRLTNRTGEYNRWQGPRNILALKSKASVKYLGWGDHNNDKQVDTNREGTESWEKNGLVLKAIDWHIGNTITAGVGYKWSF